MNQAVKKQMEDTQKRKRAEAMAPKTTEEQDDAIWKAEEQIRKRAAEVEKMNEDIRQQVQDAKVSSEPIKEAKAKPVKPNTRRPESEVPKMKREHEKASTTEESSEEVIEEASPEEEEEKVIEEVEEEEKVAETDPVAESSSSEEISEEDPTEPVQEESSESAHEPLIPDHEGYYHMKCSVLGVYRNKRKGPTHGDLTSFLLGIEKNGEWIPLGKCFQRVPKEFKEMFESHLDEFLATEVVKSDKFKGTVKPQDWLKDPSNLTFHIKTKGMKETNNYHLLSTQKNKGMALITPIWVTASQEEATSLEVLESTFK